jgi:hypothetical protein
MGCHAAAAAAPLGAQTPLTISCACIISLAAHCGAAPLAAQTFTMFCPPFGAPTNPTPVRAGVFTPYGG